MAGLITRHLTLFSHHITPFVCVRRGPHYTNMVYLLTLRVMSDCCAQTDTSRRIRLVAPHRLNGVHTVQYTVHTSLSGLAPEITEKKSPTWWFLDTWDCITFEPLGLPGMALCQLCANALCTQYPGTILQPFGVSGLPEPVRTLRSLP